METGNHYNYFRDYDPKIGRYAQSDPIGISAGLNTFGYVGGKPLTSIDPLGLFEIIYKPGTGPRTFPESREFNERFGAYRATLQAYANDFQRRMSRDCVKDRDRLQRIFDKWVVWIDPNIFDPNARATATEAVTDYNNQTTQFNFGFFSQDGVSISEARLNFAHEFRHLMEENNRLFTPSAAILGKRHPMERDADRWAASCGCEGK